jgi:ABC-type glutathione transport system ATPase component
VTALLGAEEITVRFGGRDVVRSVSVEIPPGPHGVGLIGESGSGKSTIARALLALTPVAGGLVGFEGRDVRALRRTDLRAFRRAVQVVMPDGTEALDPRARVGAVEPRVLVLDEPTSALDVTVQARILALIRRLRDERGLSYLLISHNLAVVDQLCEQCVVLRDGEVVERGPTPQVLDSPSHPYTQALRSAVPEIAAPGAAA